MAGLLSETIRIRISKDMRKHIDEMLKKEGYRKDLFAVMDRIRAQYKVSTLIREMIVTYEPREEILLEIILSTDIKTIEELSEKLSPSAQEELRKLMEIIAP